MPKTRKFSAAAMEKEVNWRKVKDWLSMLIKQKNRFNKFDAMHFSWNNWFQNEDYIGVVVIRNSEYNAPRLQYKLIDNYVLIADGFNHVGQTDIMTIGGDQEDEALAKLNTIHRVRSIVKVDQLQAQVSFQIGDRLTDSLVELLKII